jgi:hypothetical protein
MGQNLDLVRMLGMPAETDCPRCKAKVSTYADDYDVQCGDPNKNIGRRSLSLYCSTCEFEWEAEYIIRAVPVAG